MKHRSLENVVMSAFAVVLVPLTVALWLVTFFGWVALIYLVGRMLLN